jgi:transposase
MKRQVFKPYNQDQPMPLPPSVEELNPEGHMVKVVNEMVEMLDIYPLKRQYKGG